MIAGKKISMQLCIYIVCMYMCVSLDCLYACVYIVHMNRYIYVCACCLYERVCVCVVYTYIGACLSLSLYIHLCVCVVYVPMCVYTVNTHLCVHIIIAWEGNTNKFNTRLLLGVSSMRESSHLFNDKHQCWNCYFQFCKTQNENYNSLFLHHLCVCICVCVACLYVSLYMYVTEYLCPSLALKLITVLRRLHLISHGVYQFEVIFF